MLFCMVDKATMRSYGISNASSARLEPARQAEGGRRASRTEPKETR